MSSDDSEYSYESDDLTLKADDSQNLIVCEPPCGSMLDYTIDKETGELKKKCISCSRRYPVSKKNYIISTKHYYQTGEDTSNEVIDYARIMSDPTIKMVYYDCKGCKKQTLAKMWRNKHSMMANYVCKECKVHYQ